MNLTNKNNKKNWVGVGGGGSCVAVVVYLFN